MRVDVLALQRFYASSLGEAARRAAARRLAALWPHADGLDVLGIGYPAPYLDRFRGAARRVVMMMPAAQGAEPWPSNGPVATALSEEARLPFMDAVFDRVLLVHALEECDAVHAMLREVWRVMAPEGRLVVIASNRWSLWAQSDASPFGYGRPYSAPNLQRCSAIPCSSRWSLHARFTFRHGVGRPARRTHSSALESCCGPRRAALCSWKL